MFNKTSPQTQLYWKPAVFSLISLTVSNILQSFSGLEIFIFNGISKWKFVFHWIFYFLHLAGFRTKNPLSVMHRKLKLFAQCILWLFALQFNLAFIWTWLVHKTKLRGCCIKFYENYQFRENGRSTSHHEKMLLGGLQILSRFF